MSKHLIEIHRFAEGFLVRPGVDARAADIPVTEGNLDHAQGVVVGSGGHEALGHGVAQPVGRDLGGEARFAHPQAQL